MPIPQLYHFGAGPGVLHPALVDSVELHGGAYPAALGRYAGGIVEARSAESTPGTRGEVGVRLFDAGAMAEWTSESGVSLILGGRYSYTGALLSLMATDVSLGYWDYQAIARYAPDRANTFRLLSFGSQDKLGAVLEEDGQRAHQELLRLQFHRAAVEWDHRYSDGRWQSLTYWGHDTTWFADRVAKLSDNMFGLKSRVEHRLSGSDVIRAGMDVLFENLNQSLDSKSQGSGPSPVGQTLSTAHGGSMDEEREFGLGFSRRKDLTLGGDLDVVLQLLPWMHLTPGMRVDMYTAGRHVHGR